MTMHVEGTPVSAPTSTSPRTAPLVRGAPLLGPLPGLLRGRFDYLEATRRRVGDIFALDLPGGRPIVLCHPTHAQHVLRDRANNYRKGGGFWEVLRVLLGDGIIVSEGERWLRQRRLMQPQFHRQRIAELVEVVIKAIDDTLATWPASSPRLEISARMSAITIEVITRTMFGDHISRAEIEETGRALPAVQSFTMIGVFTHGLPRWVPVPGRARFLAARDALRGIVARLIARQRAHGAQDGTLLAMLSGAVDAETGEPMTDEQVLDESIGIFLAGYETTSLALAWAIDLLTRNPRALERLREEVVSVLGERRLQADDLARLPYARQVLQEAIRLYPPASWLPRLAVEDDVIDGVQIPAGTTVVLPIYLWHRHPDFWPDPEVFDPDRFSPARSEGRHPFAYVPFGAGQRLCIGKELAMVEGQAALAMLVQRFRFEGIGRPPPTPLPKATLTPQGGVWARVTRL